MTFKLGETVDWFTPCPGGNLQAHRGKVIEVVAAGDVPAQATWMASPRKHESYFMLENGVTFWPRVKWLRKTKQPLQNLERGN